MECIESWSLYNYFEMKLYKMPKKQKKQEMY